MSFTHFTVEESWGEGFVGYITFENFTDRTLKGWEIEFVSPLKITEIWDASIVRRQGDRYTIRQKPWNRQVASGNRITEIIPFL